mmetsp:Transcript_15510/g.26684  ORF Transcript_15510/g.26684 Transcript_15510/m.26684 type:complete len:233 (-) Transcript_15510:630-1328(-)
MHEDGGPQVAAADVDEGPQEAQDAELSELREALGRGEVGEAEDHARDEDGPERIDTGHDGQRRHEKAPVKVLFDDWAGHARTNGGKGTNDARLVLEDDLANAGLDDSFEVVHVGVGTLKGVQCLSGRPAQNACHVVDKGADVEPSYRPHPPRPPLLVRLPVLALLCQCCVCCAIAACCTYGCGVAGAVWVVKEGHAHPFADRREEWLQNVLQDGHGGGNPAEMRDEDEQGGA